MKKSIVTHIVTMLVAIVLGWYLASMLTVKRADIVKVEDRISKAPIGGFNKFASDVQWMLFVNYCGGLESVKKENVEEIYSRLNNILGNDPNHQLAHELGGMMFSVRDPLKAVDIFTRGANNPNLKKSWKLPFYAGFVLTQHVTDAQDKDRLKKAEKMFRLALERNSSMPHVFSALIRTRAKRLQKRKNWKGIPIVNAKHAYLCALFDEWRKSGETGGGEVFSGDAASISDFRPRLLQAAQKAKASAPKNKYVLKTIAKVMDKVLKEDHLCPKCLTPYAAGDRFCSACGSRVVVYGTCPVCRRVMKGKYCTHCGCDNKRAAETLEKRKARRAARMATYKKAAAKKAAAKTTVTKTTAKK
jgi:hypothetical protein